jgi:hypothetical protein
MASLCDCGYWPHGQDPVTNGCRAAIKILHAFAIDEQSVSLELRGDDEP